MIIILFFAEIHHEFSYSHLRASLNILVAFSITITMMDYEPKTKTKGIKDHSPRSYKSRSCMSSHFQWGKIFCEIKREQNLFWKEIVISIREHKKVNLYEYILILKMWLNSTQEVIIICTKNLKKTKDVESGLSGTSMFLCVLTCAWINTCFWERNTFYGMKSSFKYIAMDPFKNSHY